MVQNTKLNGVIMTGNNTVVIAIKFAKLGETEVVHKVRVLQCKINIALQPSESHFGILCCRLSLVSRSQSLFS